AMSRTKPTAAMITFSIGATVPLSPLRACWMGTSAITGASFSLNSEFPTTWLRKSAVDDAWACNRHAWLEAPHDEHPESGWIPEPVLGSPPFAFHPVCDRQRHEEILRFPLSTWVIQVSTSRGMGAPCSFAQYRPQSSIAMVENFQ